MDRTDVEELISNGKATIEENSGASSEAWKQFMRLRHDNKLIPFVHCTKCKLVFAYDSETTATGTMLTHMKSCVTAKHGNLKIEDKIYLAKALTLLSFCAALT